MDLDYNFWGVKASELWQGFGSAAPGKIFQKFAYENAILTKKYNYNLYFNLYVINVLFS